MIYLLHHLIERAAEREAEREAFRTPGESLTYGELLGRANRLAHALVREGVGRGDRVGILAPRTVETAVAVYGISKAGAAFVPIDPRIPAGGLRQLIADCGIHTLISHDSERRTLERLAAGAPPLRTVIGPGEALEGEVQVLPWRQLEDLPAGAGPDLHALDDDLAYLMYSSGSTGRPKGIMHTHRSGLAYAALSAETYSVVPEDRVGNHSPLHFDMSTFGYLTVPLAGATTVLIPEAYTKLAASLSQLIETERLTIWYSVPLALVQLLGHGVLDERDLSSLRWVLFGGEPFARQHLEALQRHWPRARFSNVYGPAEVNQCTYYHLPRAGSEEGPVPIGRIWGNTEGLVLDEGERPVAAGEAGELAVRSATMMRGYWRRPDLDARAFLRRDEAGLERVYYRTGDLVRERPDGELLFLGRKDRQRKVRGYRVELDEIEATLASHPDVEEAAVFPVERGGELDHLAAAATLKPGADSEVDSEALLAFLGDLVSWYARPARLEVLDSFPRTTSGKIDRRRLQEAAEADRS